MLATKFFQPLFILFLLIGATACNTAESDKVVKTNTIPPATTNTVQHPDWAKDMIMYEVNVRNYSEEGSFKEFEKHLPRIKELGVNTLWFMPIHPIAEEKIKGSLGSYFAIKDYETTNPRMGTMEDFKSLVDKAHQMGMKVLVEWVANHAGWDSKIALTHPDWVTQDDKGNFIPPVPDWSDVIELNYDNKELWNYMQEEIIRWVKETDVDGFRYDVAGMMPAAFYEELKVKLDAVKPLFVFTDGKEVSLMDKALNMVYTYEILEVMSAVAKGEKSVSAISDLLAKEDSVYYDNAYKFYFTSGHSSNAFEGTVFEKLGAAAATCIVLTSTLHGIPMIYSGQESGLDKRLSFYEKDLIEWKEHEFTDLYKKLFTLKKHHPALWAGKKGGKVQQIPIANNEKVFAYSRTKGDDKVLIYLNFSNEPQSFSAQTESGTYQELFTENQVQLTPNQAIELAPWGYQVLFRP